MELLDLSSFHINWRGTGSEQYPLGMMLYFVLRAAGSEKDLSAVLQLLQAGAAKLATLAVGF